MRPSLLSSALGRNAASKFRRGLAVLGLADAVLPDENGTRAARPASRRVVRPRTSRSRFIRRTGTASPMAFRTRKPVAWAIASSRRRFSCSALTAASVWLRCCLSLRMVDGAFGIGADFAYFALLAAFGDDGLGGELAGLVLRPVALVLACSACPAESSTYLLRGMTALPSAGLP